MNKHIFHILCATFLSGAPTLHGLVSLQDIQHNTPKLVQAIDKADLESFMGLFDLTCVYDEDNTQVPGLIDAYTAMLQELEDHAHALRHQLQQEWQNHTIHIITMAKGLGQLFGGAYLTSIAPMYAGWHRISGNQITQTIVGSITSIIKPKFMQKPCEQILTMPAKYAVPTLVATTAAGVYGIKNGIKNMAIGFYYREYLDQKLQDLQAILNRIEKAKVLLEITTGQDTPEQDDDTTPDEHKRNKHQHII